MNATKTSLMGFALSCLLVTQMRAAGQTQPTTTTTTTPTTPSTQQLQEFAYYFAESAAESGNDPTGNADAAYYYQYHAALYQQSANKNPRNKEAAKMAARLRYYAMLYSYESYLETGSLDSLGAYMFGSAAEGYGGNTSGSSSSGSSGSSASTGSSSGGSTWSGGSGSSGNGGSSSSGGSGSGGGSSSSGMGSGYTQPRLP